MGAVSGSAVDIRAAVLDRSRTPLVIAEEVLAAIGDDEFRAWSALDADGLRRQALTLESVAEPERRRRPLFGVPVAIKDNIDTADFDTAYGSSIYAGHRPAADAVVVAQLRAAGALIVGKTKCTEFAWMTATDTRNPLDPTRTPGGSSSGSAVAVAAGHVPLALGTQTAGSVNRPASYCGVLGYTPSAGLYDRTGMKLMSETLDSVGVFGRSTVDLGLVDEALTGVGRRVGAASRTPRVGFAPTPFWPRLDEDAATSIETWVEGACGIGLLTATDVDLPGYESLAVAHETIQRYESARSLGPEVARAPELLSYPLRATLLAAGRIPRRVYDRARAEALVYAPALAAALGKYDGVIVPSTTGVAPRGLDFTGDPLFCRAWTLLHAPAISLPLVRSAAGLPVGLQIVGRPGGDADLLAAAETVCLAGLSLPDGADASM
ncbi:MAG: hypothetical protein BGO11_14115 [Solirubrobacterales bacterium 70-9]|nr:MAG: hypothetical protein BGO11_14115 [Solirubrobacterales bacterium 70-9]